MLLQLGLVLPGQLLVLALELGDENLPLDLLLLLQRQKLLLELLVAHGRASHASASTGLPAPGDPGRLLARWGELGQLLLLLVGVHAQVHGDGSGRETQGQRGVDVH